MPKSVVLDDIGLPLRFKHGSHSLFLFVDPLGPFSKITDEILEILRERYPDGELRQSTARGDVTTQIPQQGTELRVSYAILKNPNNQSSGWRDLNISGDDTPVGKNLKENMAVAFALQGPDDVDEEPKFIVDFPVLEDDDRESA